MKAKHSGSNLSVIPVLDRQRQEDYHEFEASYGVRPRLKNPKLNNNSLAIETLLINRNSNG